jgi:hypothetical protein
LRINEADQPIVLHHAQPHHLLAGGAALVQHFEQHHVPPTDDEQQDRAQADSQFAEERQDQEEQAEHQPAYSQVDGEGQRTGHQARRAQRKVDAFGRLDLVARVQWRRQRRVPLQCWCLEHGQPVMGRSNVRSRRRC